MSEYEQLPSYWMSQKDLPTFEPLKNELKVQVAIVGGGISGLTVAYELSRRGISTAILEDGAICGGESSRTTAHLSNALDDRYYILEQYLGKENARLAAESHAAAIDYIESVCKEKKIECDFERLDAYLFNPPGKESENLVKEMNAAKRCGIPVTMVDQSPIESYNTGPCVKFPSQAEFSPIKYYEGLSRSIIEMGGKIFDHTHVKDIRESNEINGACQLVTDKGFVIDAEHVVIATNSPINNPFFPHLKQASYRTYVIAAKIPKGYVPKALYYDTLDPYHYIRIIEESDESDLLLVGGEDHRVGEFVDYNEIYEILERWTRTRFPKMGPVIYKWSGQIVEPIDSIAFIGRSKSNSKIFIATGDSGNGLTHGTIAGMLISDLITGKSNPWEKLYDPSRKSLSSLPDFIEENAVTFAQYRDWLTEGDVNNIKEIRPNSGAVLREGVQKIAVYKDDKEQIHVMSAVCPHLQGLVRWNEAEKSWDCPCHGSRFTATGEVINGPANCPLKHIEKAEVK